MIKTTFQKLKTEFYDTSEIPKGREFLYRCARCEDTISSVPAASISCRCGNIFIDNQYVRLAVVDMSMIEVLTAAR